MDMDETGRNGRKWHLAQQITQLVTLYIFQQLAHHVIISCNIQTTNRILSIHNSKNGGDFLFSYKYQKISPHSLIIIIYNLLTNR